MDFWFPGIIDDVVRVIVDFLSLRGLLAFQRCCRSSSMFECSPYQLELAKEMRLYVSTILTRDRKLATSLDELDTDGTLRWRGLERLFEAEVVMPSDGKRCSILRADNANPTKMVYFPLCRMSLSKKVNEKIPIVYFLPERCLDPFGLVLVVGDSQSAFVMSLVFHHITAGKNMLVLTDNARFGFRKIGFSDCPQIVTKSLTSSWQEAGAYDYVILDKLTGGPFDELLVSYLVKILALGANVILSSEHRVPQRVSAMSSVVVKFKGRDAYVVIKD